MSTNSFCRETKRINRCEIATKTKKSPESKQKTIRNQTKNHQKAKKQKANKNIVKAEVERGMKRNVGETEDTMIKTKGKIILESDMLFI
jgi:hypothetical protein